jgi:hypothetical protein
LLLEEACWGFAADDEALLAAAGFGRGKEGRERGGGAWNDWNPWMLMNTNKHNCETVEKPSDP